MTTMAIDRPIDDHRHAPHAPLRCRATHAGRCPLVEIVWLDAVEAGNALDEVFEAMSDTARYFRFLGPMPRLNSTARRVLSSVEPGRHEIWGARCDGRTVGLVRIVRDREGRVELAIETADSHNRQGIATRLIRTALMGARAWGEQSVYLVVHPRNRAALELFRRSGAEFRYDEGVMVGTVSTDS